MIILKLVLCIGCILMGIVMFIIGVMFRKTYKWAEQLKNKAQFYNSNRMLHEIIRLHKGYSFYFVVAIFFFLFSVIIFFK